MCSSVTLGWFDLDPAVIGLALTLLLQLAGTNFPWMVRQSAEVVNQMVSVERLSAYADLEPEAPTKTASDDDYDDFPGDASIVLDRLTVRYQDSLPPALNSVAVKIRGGHKVGVVGRYDSFFFLLLLAFFASQRK